MSRANAFTLLSLNKYAKIMHLDPLAFAQGETAVRPADASCRDVWFQYDWQNQQIASREHVADKIAGAELDIAEQLGYWPAPLWIADERIPYPRTHPPEITDSGMDVRYRFRGVQARWGQVMYGGQRATTLLDVPTAMAFVDADGDGFEELVRFTLTLTETVDPCEVKAYFKVYDAADADNCRTDPSSSGADPVWEVRPLTVTISGLTLTVYCNSWDIFKPQLQESFTADIIDADDVNSYVDALLFYREYNDPETQVQFLWGNDIYCGADVSIWTTQSGVLQILNKRNSLVKLIPATYNASDDTFAMASQWTNCYEPDGVRLWYRAGYTEPTKSCPVLNEFWAETIAILATARIEQPICTCNAANQRVIAHWQNDLAMLKESGSHYAMSDVLNCPFGTRAGEVEAWRRINRGRGRAKGQGVIT